MDATEPVPAAAGGQTPMDKGQHTAPSTSSFGSIVDFIIRFKEGLAAAGVIALTAIGAFQYFATRIQLEAVDCNLHEMESQLDERMAILSYQDQITTLQHEQDELLREKSGQDNSSRVERVIDQRKQLEEKVESETKALQRVQAERNRKCYESLMYPKAPSPKE